jgi:hypothetical protein
MEVYDATVGGGVGVTAAMNANEAQASLISANAASDHFFGTALDPKWTQEGAGAPQSISVADSTLTIVNAGGSSATHYTTPYAPPGAFTVEMRARRIHLGTNGNGGGIFVRDSGALESNLTGILITFDDGNNGECGWYTVNNGSFSSQGGSLTGIGIDWTYGYFRLTRNASNVCNAYWSPDRNQWYQIGNANVSFTFTAAKLGIRQNDHTNCAYDLIDVVDGTVGAQAGLVSALPPASGAGQAVVSGASAPYAPGWGGDTAWTIPTLVNSFTAATTDTHQQGPRYRKDAMGFVHMQGSFTNGSTGGTVIFTLPAGYRPGGMFYWFTRDTSQNGDDRYVRVDTDGTVKFWGNNPTVRNTQLDGLTFFAEN